ncbi:HNH endonuclease signature motif containing protein [Edwardsiella piscicida]
MNYSDIFDYSDGFLYWKKSGDWRIKAGDVAGFKHSSGYVAVSVDSRLVLAHRVIWEMLRGEIPLNMEIDHIDKCRSNNLIENLRLVSRTENLRNKGMYKNNTSGVTGVVFNKQKNKWSANIRVNGKLKFLGYHSDFEEACKARCLAENLYGFSPAHGKCRS